MGERDWERVREIARSTKMEGERFTERRDIYRDGGRESQGERGRD